jgi:hypothetical protein
MASFSCCLLIIWSKADDINAIKRYYKQSIYSHKLKGQEQNSFYKINKFFFLKKKKKKEREKDDKENPKNLMFWYCFKSQLLN